MSNSLLARKEEFFHFSGGICDAVKAVKHEDVPVEVCSFQCDNPKSDN